MTSTHQSIFNFYQPGSKVARYDTPTFQLSNQTPPNITSRLGLVTWKKLHNVEARYSWYEVSSGFQCGKSKKYPPFFHRLFTIWFTDAKHEAINHLNKCLNFKFYNVAVKGGTQSSWWDDIETCKWATMWTAPPCHCIQKGERAQH